MKKILSVVMILCLAFSLTGCKKCIDIDYKEVEVSIVDEYHRSAYVTPIRINNRSTLRRHPAVHRITVEYSGVQYTIDDSKTYNQYKDKVGQTAIGILETRGYDDGSARYDITKLQLVNPEPN